MNRQGGQDVAAAPFSKFRGDPWACFDRLPAPVRQALRESNVDWCPLQARWLLNKAIKAGLMAEEAAAAAVRRIEHDDRDEAYLFGLHWPSRHGKYPALAARSSFVRYDASSSRAGQFPLPGPEGEA